MKRGLARDPKTVPHVRTGLPLPAEKVALVDLLRVLLKSCAARHKVAPRLIADGDDLERLAVEDAPDVAAMKGWRYELFGIEVEKLKRGELALKVDRRGGRVRRDGCGRSEDASKAARRVTRVQRLPTYICWPARRSGCWRPARVPGDGIRAHRADDGDQQRQHQHAGDDHHSH